MKIIFRMPQVSGVPTSIHTQPSRKRTTTLVASLLLAAAFGLAVAPAETAATAAPAFTNNHVTFIEEPPAPCRGDKPGVCPNSPFTRLDEQAAADQPTQSQL